ncbi:response regulator [Paraglaciecola sp. 2405UD69-4]|uniref:response regulator n=1 Tax=Paraglaciecola sp. 2405UD69-4 TaxID=3391836 RepID=UPI0039C8EE80
MPIPVTIADDSALSRKNVRRAIPEEWDVSISEAKNGQEAVDAIEAGLAEILFLDLTMPILDGFDVLRYVKEHNKKTVVIVISADIQPKSVELVNSLGAFRFLQKPLKGEELKQTLHEVGLI